MLIIDTIKQMQKLADDLREDNNEIGFVPTMGFLHEGHKSLIKIARQKCEFLVVSIFVNPTQFGENEDLEKYPRDFERDKNICQEEDVDAIFFPDVKEMYPEPFHTFVTIKKLTETMCGLRRPNHFRGVATIVCKLFNCVKPHLAVFGQKDFQQLQVIKKMVTDLNMTVEIISAPIIREADGLALSSRNKYLNPAERKNAAVLYQSLKEAEKLILSGERDAAKINKKITERISSIPNMKIEYVVIVDPETLQPVEQISDPTLIALAAIAGSTRLIDNLLINLTE